MSKTRVDGQQRAYEEALRGAVADLPATEVEELLDALREHLVEARAAQPEASLHDILGPPERFAHEFRVASGFEDQPHDEDSEPSKPETAWWRRWMFPFGVLVYAAGAVCFTVSIVNVGNEGYALPGGALFVLGILIAASGHRYADPVSPATARWADHRTALARGYFAIVKPLRGWGLVVALDWYVIGGSVYDPAPTGFPLPDYLGLSLGVLPGGSMGGLVVILCAVLVSVWLGLRERSLGRWRALVVPVELILASAPILAAVSYSLHF
jgi:hypothetical protein